MMKNELRLLVIAALSAIAGLAGTAGAQVRPEAEKLFRDGKELVKQGKLAEACAAFEASERADHSLATVMSLADCRERNHQLASAWALFLQADSETRTDASRAALNRTARLRAAALEPRLSYLTINVADESRVEGLVVSRDGRVLDPAEWNRSIPIDGGPHEITGKAPGHESWSTRVVIAPERDKQSVEVPKFKELPKLVTPHPPRVGAVAPDGPPARIPPAPSRFTPRRKLALGLAAGGVVLAGAGIGFGLSARGLDDDALARCPPSACSAADAAAANALNDRARSRALVANISFAAAGAAAIAGAVLWYLGAPPAAGLEVAPQLGEAAGLTVTRRF